MMTEKLMEISKKYKIPLIFNEDFFAFFIGQREDKEEIKTEIKVSIPRFYIIMEEGPFLVIQLRGLKISKKIRILKQSLLVLEKRRVRV